MQNSYNHADGTVSLVVADEKGNMLMINKQHMLQKLHDVYTFATSKTAKDSFCLTTTYSYYLDYLTKEQVTTAFNSMSNVINRMTTETLLKVLNLLSKTKSGNVRCKIHPVYMTGLKLPSYRVYDSVELSAIPLSEGIKLDRDIFYNLPDYMRELTDKYDAHRVFYIDYITPKWSKSNISILTDDCKINTCYKSVDHVQNKYIPNKELEIGHVYTDNKGRDLLYIGSMFFEYGLSTSGYTSQYCFMIIKESDFSALKKFSYFADYFKYWAEVRYKKNPEYRFHDIKMLESLNSVKLCKDKGKFFDKQYMTVNYEHETHYKNYSDYPSQTTIIEINM